MGISARVAFRLIDQESNFFPTVVNDQVPVNLRPHPARDASADAVDCTQALPD